MWKTWLQKIENDADDAVETELLFSVSTVTNGTMVIFVVKSWWQQIIRVNSHVFNVFLTMLIVRWMHRNELNANLPYGTKRTIYLFTKIIRDQSLNTQKLTIPMKNSSEANLSLKQGMKFTWFGKVMNTVFKNILITWFTSHLSTKDMKRAKSRKTSSTINSWSLFSAKLRK